MSNILYKYLDIKGAKMMLHYRRLQYTNATMFNDPFDCHPSLIDYSNISSESKNVWPPKEIIQKQDMSRHDNYRNNLWISCLSKVYDGLLMWSYYNKHNGVCIGLNMDEVGKYLKNPLYGMDICTKAKDVEYTDIIHKPDYYSDCKDFFNYQVFTKAKAWEHEQEVRLYIYKPSSGLFGTLPFQQNRKEFAQKELRAFVPIGPECFESIYFGVNIHGAEKYEITQFAKRLNPNIKIFQMEINPDAFSLVAKQEIENKLEKYIDYFSNLHRNKIENEIAPHKPIMLLSIINLIGNGFIRSNKIEFSEILESDFNYTWELYVDSSSKFKPIAGSSFCCLNSEPFWKLVSFKSADETISALQKSNSYSLDTIRKYIRYAEIDMDLFNLLQDKYNREVLHKILIESLCDI